MNGLVKFRLAWVLGFHEVENVIDISAALHVSGSITALISVSSEFQVLNELKKQNAATIAAAIIMRGATAQP